MPTMVCSWKLMHSSHGVELGTTVLRKNPHSRWVEDSTQGPPDIKSSALNHSAALPPLNNFITIYTIV